MNNKPIQSEKLPPGWNWVKLHDMCQFIRGVSFGGADFNYIYLSDHIPILRAGNINGSLKLNEDLIWIPSKFVSQEQILQIGDIVICMSSGSPSVVGKTAQLKEKWNGSVGAFCGIIRSRDSNWSDYLGYWFRSLMYFDWRNEQTRGANIQNLRFSQFEKILFPLPPLDEQKRIVKILEEKLAAVEKAKKAAEEKLQAANTLKQSYLDQIFNEEKLKKSLPKKWKLVKMGEICEINPRRQIERDDNKLTSFVPMECVDETKGTITRSIQRPFKEIKKGYTYFQESDILFAKITPCMQNGKHAIAENLTDGIGFGTTEFHVLRPLASVIPQWIHFFLRRKETLSEAEKHFTGAVGQQRVPKDFLANLSILLPPIGEQKQITKNLSHQFEKTDKLTEKIQDELELINKLPQSYLKQAFEGKL